MHKSDKPVKKEHEVLGKRMYVFGKEYATDFDPLTQKRGMAISIGQHLTFIPCEEPVELTYEIWSLLKNIGRIGRVVGVPIPDEKDESDE